MLVLTLGTAVLHSASAQAGEWVQRSCSFGDEYIAPEGWEAEANYGYDGAPPDELRKVSTTRGGLVAYAAAVERHQTALGHRNGDYKPPRDSTIAGGEPGRRHDRPQRRCLVEPMVEERPVTLASCENPRLPRLRADPADRSQRARANCTRRRTASPPAKAFAPPRTSNPTKATVTSAAEVNITSAQIVLSTNATPAASGFGGTLLGAKPSPAQARSTSPPPTRVPAFIRRG